MCMGTAYSSSLRTEGKGRLLSYVVVLCHVEVCRSEGTIQGRR